MKYILSLFLVILAANTFLAQTGKPVLTEKQKIEGLIKSIENLKDAQFWRNGEYHTPKEAADHLRMKLGKAGNRIKTAHQFIDNIATKSSMSGEVYKIKFKDGKVMESKTFLYQKLTEIEK
ncbi:MAG: DUF5329 family protein [Bacteroidales bacterium]